MNYEKKDIIREAKGLYGDINTCISDLVNAKIARDLYMEGRANVRMQGLMTAVMQYLGCVIDFLEEQKECLADDSKTSESEDERIRKALLDYYGKQCDMSDVNGVYAYEVCAWLEKQKEPENISVSTMAPSCWELEQKEQKSAEWSEEDETCLEYALWCVMKTRHFVAKDACDLDACRCAERWLEFLPKRFNLKPKQEWSEEDWQTLDEMREHLICVVGDKPDSTPNKIFENFINLIDKLKSLPLKCPKSTDNWKPSEEQMKQLESAADLPEFGPMVTTRKQFPALESLYNDLKKLM